MHHGFWSKTCRTTFPWPRIQPRGCGILGGRCNFMQRVSEPINQHQRTLLATSARNWIHFINGQNLLADWCWYGIKCTTMSRSMANPRLYVYIVPSCPIDALRWCAVLIYCTQSAPNLDMCLLRSQETYDLRLDRCSGRVRSAASNSGPRFQDLTSWAENWMAGARDNCPQESSIMTNIAMENPL